ncbi:hypothetical protein ABN763_18875 [Spongiivirga sp. MCCC 1A20706]|uniref:hypothetical protein n=1 Tax=Spongiivirga sp. MCCC 1A20706 TaxID=3160963 RepID=UPI003977B69C
MVSLIGLIILIFAGINFCWILLWYVLNLSGKAGAQLSKKIGTDNKHTDEYLETGKHFSKELVQKLLWRFVLVIIGYLLYTFG